MTTTTTDRTTSLGRIIMTVTDGKVTMTLNGKTQDGWLNELAKPLVKDGVTYSHSFGGFAIRAEEAQAALQAIAEHNASPAGQRLALAQELASVDAGAYPGSREFARGQAVEAKIAAFDAAHPEVIAALRAAAESATDYSLANRIAQMAD